MERGLRGARAAGRRRDLDSESSAEIETSDRELKL